MKKILKSVSLGVLLALTATSVRGATIFQDSFTYSDGALPTVSSGTWFYHSTSTSDLNVSSGQAQLVAGSGSDASANLTGAPYASAALTAALYAKFTLNVTALPTSSGTHVVHFKDSGNGTTFRARVYLSTSGAGAGAFRVGIANTTATINNLPTDLALNTTYTVVIRYVLATGVSTLWIDPVNETSTSVNATDAANTSTAMSCIALRQATGGGTVLVDDLVVGTGFADVLPSSAGSNPPFITRNPQGGNISAGVSFTFTNVAGGDLPLYYQWKKDDAEISGANASTYVLPAPIEGDTGDYSVVVTNSSGSVTSTVAHLTVTAVAVGPTITNQPASQSGSWGSSVTFSVGADGTQPLYYQWRFYGTNLSGATATYYTVNNLFTNHAGPYTVVVSNVANVVTSTPAILTVVQPPVTNIAFLHSLMDTNYTPTNTSTLFTVEGIVTTHQNMTPAPNALFYLQDASAGVACFWGGSTNGDVSTNLPPAGARVRVTAPLASYQGLLELSPVGTNLMHGVTILSSNNPLPTPASVPFDATQSDPAIMDPMEGKYVVASNVFIELTTPTFSGTCLVTNSLGETFTLFANASTDISGQTKPLGPVTILGVLGQYDTSNPRTSGYQLIPSRYADIISQAKSATVRFTNVLSNLVRPGQPTPNTLTDGVLRPGEKLTMSVQVSDPEGGNVTITPLTAGLPSSAAWVTGATTGTNVTATFTFQPVAGDAGANYQIALRTVNTYVTSTNLWQIYVPTPVEQRVFITEFLANPTSDTNQLHFNPLHRADVPTSSISTYDEYLEIANQSDTDVDLYNWSIADAVGRRHVFYNGAPGETLGASNAIVVYGGPMNGNAPVLPVLAFPASESSAGLALNNTGNETITLRNGSSNVIDRILYSGNSLSSQGSLVRFPTLNSDFVPQPYVGSNTSAGVQYDGGAWNLPTTLPTGVSGISVTYGNPVVLNYSAVVSHAYTLWQSDEANEPFVIVNGGFATSAAGAFYITNAPATRQFYFITTP
jgi:hypothetical protein